MYVGEATLGKRISEFTGTDQAGLTADKFNSQIMKHQREEAARIEALKDSLTRASAAPTPQQEGCRHIRKSLKAFACDAHPAMSVVVSCLRMWCATLGLLSAQQSLQYVSG